MEKPIKKYVTFNRFEGHYDWCHPNKIIEFLESVSEENDILKKEYDIEYAKYQIEYWQNKLSQLPHPIEGGACKSSS